MSTAPAGTGKGRPTPKRGAVARRPAPPPPRTRKEAARLQRDRSAPGAPRGAGRAGRPLNGRDAGPVRRLVRDLVDSRRHPGVLLLPAAVLPFAAQSVGGKRLIAIAGELWMLGLLVAIADFVSTGLLIRQRLRRDHPGEPRTGGHIAYGLMRTTQFRRLRVPRPEVKVGTKV